MDEKDNKQIEKNENAGNTDYRELETDTTPTEETESKEPVFSQPDEEGVRYYSLGPQSQQYYKKRSRGRGFIIFGVIVVVLIFLGVSCTSAFRPAKTDDGFSSVGNDYIGVLYIEGTIAGESGSSLSDSTYSQSWILSRIDDAMDNSKNKGLILYLNTPGGAVYETDEVYLKLQEYRKTTGRPVYAAMGSMAASGGYYIAAAADKIVANRNCWTGSIGVMVGTLYDVSEFLDKYGVNTVTITSGKNKAMGSMTDPMTKEQKAIMQSLVDEAYDQFVDIVAKGRQMNEKKVRKLADGRIYTAKQAKKHGLVDEIGTLEDTIKKMKQEQNLQGCDTVEMQYESPSTLSSIFSQLNVLADKSQSDVSALLQIMEKQGEMPISYMSQMTK